jgi:hypothetical protein
MGRNSLFLLARMSAMLILTRFMTLILMMVYPSLCLLCAWSKYMLDDPTNLHRHAKHNAQEAIVLAKQRAQQFDAQAALERKTNEALKLAKAQAHIHEDTEDPSPASIRAPLVDRESNKMHGDVCAHLFSSRFR